VGVAPSISREFAFEHSSATLNSHDTAKLRIVTLKKTLQMNSSQPPNPQPTEPPFAVPGGWSERSIELNGRTLQISVPANSDAFLDAGTETGTVKKSDDTPTWPYLWPAALEMARVVPSLLEHVPSSARAVELGCGIGLVGLSAAHSGAQVTFTDYEQDAVQLAAHNARRNGFSNAVGKVLDWNKPPDQSYPVILACDVLYETKNHEPLLQLIDSMLAADGVCWIGEPGRINAERFVEFCKKNLAERNLQLNIRNASGSDLEEFQLHKFQILEITRSRN